MDSIRSVNPHRPSDVVWEGPPAGAEGVERAVSRATAAASAWREETASARGEALARVGAELEGRAGEVTDLVVREVGKPVKEARGEVARAVAILRYYAQMVLGPDGETYPPSAHGSLMYARRFPLGVCALITPWNFPVAIPVWKLAPALGYGNAVVLKPAPAGTAAALLLHEICSASGLPDGLFEVVPGDAETGEPLVEHEGVAAVSFTGSVPVGRAVAERVARRGARFQAEMGGQNASVVLSDADLQRAARTVAYAAMGYAGQKCTATSRIVVEAPVYDEFRDRVVGAVEALGVVDPAREDVLVGPVIEPASRDGALEAVANGGGRVLTGGVALDGEGFYVAPTLVELDEPVGPLAKEEVFAPVASLLRAASADEAVAIANDVRYGLVAAVFTDDLGRALDVANRMEAGLVRVNAATSGVDYHAPFGGSKASSIGPREQGLAARDFYTESRTILISP